MTMIKSKEPIIERVFWPELETVFPSKNRRVPKQFIAGMILDKTNPAEKKEENIETGDCQEKRENLKFMETKDLKQTKPFSVLFSIDRGIFHEICEDMRAHGYDYAQPVVIWKEKGIVIDGHTRVDAALKLGIKNIPVLEKDFADEEEALNYAIHCQVDRRNLTDAQVLSLVELLDQRKKVGRPPREITSDEAKSSIGLMLQKMKADGEKVAYENFKKRVSRSSKITAALLNTSASKVEKARTVLDKGSEKIKGEVFSGEITINKAYAETLKKPTPRILRFESDGLQAVLTMNRNVGQIEWIILGSGEYPNLPANSGNFKTLDLKTERFY